MILIKPAVLLRGSRSPLFLRLLVPRSYHNKSSPEANDGHGNGDTPSAPCMHFRTDLPFDAQALLASLPPDGQERFRRMGKLGFMALWKAFLGEASDVLLAATAGLAPADVDVDADASQADDGRLQLVFVQVRGWWVGGGELQRCHLAPGAGAQSLAAGCSAGGRHWARRRLSTLPWGSNSPPHHVQPKAGSDMRSLPSCRLCCCVCRPGDVAGLLHLQARVSVRP